MSYVHHSERVVARPVRDVWAFIADVQNWPRWVPGVAEARIIAGAPNALGARVYEVRSAGQEPVEIAAVVEEYQPPSRFVTRLQVGLFDCCESYQLDSCPEGTRATYRIEGKANVSRDREQLEQAWGPFVEHIDRCHELLVKVLEAPVASDGQGSASDRLQSYECHNCGAPLLVGYRGAPTCTYCGRIHQVGSGPE